MWQYVQQLLHLWDHLASSHLAAPRNRQNKMKALARMKTGNQKNKFSFGFWQRLLPEPVNSPYKHQSRWQFILGTIGLDSQVSFFFSVLSLTFLHHFAGMEVCFGWQRVTKYIDRSKWGGNFVEAQSTLARVHMEFIINTIWLSTSVFWGKSVPSPWIITINQKEWILTYRRLDGSQVELLFDPHHLSREIKFGGGGKKKKHQFHILLLHIAQRLAWSFMPDKTLFFPSFSFFFFYPSTTYNLVIRFFPYIFGDTFSALLNACWCDAARFSLSIKRSGQRRLESAGNFVPVKFPSLVSFTSALQLLMLSLPISPRSNLSNPECTENGMKKLP